MCKIKEEKAGLVRERRRLSAMEARCYCSQKGNCCDREWQADGTLDTASHHKQPPVVRLELLDHHLATFSNALPLDCFVFAAILSECLNKYWDLNCTCCLGTCHKNGIGLSSVLATWFAIPLIFVSHRHFLGQSSRNPSCRRSNFDQCQQADLTPPTKRTCPLRI